MRPHAPHAIALALLVATSTLGCGDDESENTGGAGTGGESSSSSRGTGGEAAGTGGEAAGTGGEAAGTGGEGTGGDGLITTECGTFDPNQVGDSVIPDDPADPAIVASCEDFCDAFGPVCENGGFSRDTCIDECRMRTCGYCPGTLLPLVECETQEGDAQSCECEDGVLVCSTPNPCSDLWVSTTQCGG